MHTCLSVKVITFYALYTYNYLTILFNRIFWFWVMLKLFFYAVFSIFHFNVCHLFSFCAVSISVGRLVLLCQMADLAGGLPILSTGLIEFVL